QVQIHTQGLNLLLDLGFQGAEKDCPCAILPFKKPKKRELTDLQKSINKGISKERVLIENVFSSIKRLKIVRNKVRLKCSKARHLIMMLAVGLHNLRNKFRKPIINHS
ncbi:transposase family protein, partial [Dyadobacter sp. 3J3]|uniref:transposase family protein n=1 Tax=Dyadobacter sp. 3J3 TaxID=2606600 RepID=UPI001358B6A9